MTKPKEQVGGGTPPPDLVCDDCGNLRRKCTCKKVFSEPPLMLNGKCTERNNPKVVCFGNPFLLGSECMSCKSKFGAQDEQETGKTGDA